MTVYKAFNEAEGLDDSTGTASSSTTAVSGVARSGFTSDNDDYDSWDVTFDALSEGWIHFTMHIDFGFASGDQEYFQLFDDSGGEFLYLYGLRGDGYQVQARSVLDSTLENITNSSETVKYDIWFKVDATIGFVRVYADGVLVYEKEGDTVGSTGVTTCDKFRFRGARRGSGVADNTRIHFGQVIVSDEVTIGSQVYTLDPTAGSVNTWDLGTVTDVDEQDVDDTDQANTTTNGDEFTIDTSVTLSSLTSPQKFSAVVQSFRGSYDGGSSVTQLTPFLNDTTATSTSDGTTQSLTTGLANYQYVWSNDPADSSDWTASKINDYEFGLRATT